VSALFTVVVGRSQRIPVAAGLIDPSHGEAYLFGRSIRRESALLRDWVGICSQDDLLWEELTARQHLQLYARFKVRRAVCLLLEGYALML